MLQRVRGRMASGLVVSLAALVSSQPALAVCMPTTNSANASAGPPAISATEASTTEMLDKIRERREEVVTTSNTAAAQPAPVASTVQSEPAPQSSGSSSGTPKKAKAAKASQAADSASSSAPASKAKKYQPAPEPVPAEEKYTQADVLSPLPEARSGSYGAWASGFIDYERHSNLAPGQQANPTRKTTTGGGLAGVDWTVMQGGVVPSGVQFGVFSGYSRSNGKFSDTTGSQTVNEPRDGDPTLVPVTYTVSTSNSEQTVEGGIVGLYGSYFSGGFSADLAFKVDIFDYSRSANVFQQKPALVEDNGDPDVCGGGTRDFNQRLSGSTDQTDYILAANANYKFDLSDGYWLEPTVGFRYTYTDFGGGSAALGLKNGEAFRLQGGLRLGVTRLTADGYVWTGSIAGILYSDVAISGFNVTDSAFPSGFAEVDEGKLRVLGTLQSALYVGNGVTYFGEAGIRGGEDVFGIGGLAGVRYNW